MAGPKNSNVITLRGSADLVAEYLKYGVNSILYQRAIYPAETFEPVQQYGMTILVSTDPKIKTFLDSVLDQTREWLINRKIRKINLIIKNLNTKETVESWEFNVEYEDGISSVDRGLDKKPLSRIENTQLTGEPAETKKPRDKLADVGNKDIKVIQKEIRDVMLQICSTITFLPLLDCLCSFDILVYTFKDTDIPNEWDESEPCFIANAQQVKLKPFSSSLHRVDTAVSYKGDF